MALYLMNTKGKDDKRLISADTRHAAEQHFIGKHTIECRTITDPAEGAELAAQFPLEKAGEVPADPPPATDDQDDADAKASGATRKSGTTSEE